VVFVIITCVYKFHISGDFLISYHGFFMGEYLSDSISIWILEFWLFHFCSLFVQHELGVAADDGLRHLVEQTEGEVSPADKAAAMTAAIEKRAVQLRIKMGKLVAVANPELTDGWLREVSTSTFVHIKLLSLYLRRALRNSHALCHTD
jgi:hypothetical protein